MDLDQAKKKKKKQIQAHYTAKENQNLIEYFFFLTPLMVSSKK